MSTTRGLCTRGVVADAAIVERVVNVRICSHVPGHEVVDLGGQLTFAKALMASIADVIAGAAVMQSLV